MAGTRPDTLRLSYSYVTQKEPDCTRKTVRIITQVT